MNLHELRARLQNSSRPNLVYFGDGLPTTSDQWAIEKDRGLWQVYCFERGAKFGEHWFADETSACDYLWNEIEKDVNQRS